MNFDSISVIIYSCNSNYYAPSLWGENIKMKQSYKIFLIIIILAATVFGSYVSFNGIGNIEPVNDSLKYGLDINGGVYLLMEAETDLTDEDLARVMNETRDVVANRVNQLGLSESTVTVEGEDRIRVELPGVTDASEAIDVIGQTASLEFKLSNNEFVLDGSMVEDAYPSLQDGSYVINLEFSPEGAELFREATEIASSGQVSSTIDDVLDNAIIIELDGEIISSPTVDSVIPNGECYIHGGFTQESAESLAALIRGGALPTPLVEVNSSVQTATIGEDALSKSIVAGGIGLLLVFAFMIVTYKLLGVVASIGLILYVLIVAWSMALLGNVLTLPGIAGIILSIGMAVDANIIIFSRIRDEIRQSKTVRVAVNRGFKSALTTVLDAQLTTLIAAVVLYQVGTTSVKGFAITLMIGIVVSIFTAIVITQLFVSAIAHSRRFGKKEVFGIKDKESTNSKKRILTSPIDIVKNRKKYYTVSAVVFIIGLSLFVIRGFNFGIDFTGGTMMQIDMGATVTTSEINTSLSSFNLDETIIFTGEDEEQVIIRTRESLNNDSRNDIIATLNKDFGVEQSDVLAIEQFGASVGEELQLNAITSILIASLGMLLYIIFRFKSWLYGAAAISGIIHDIMAVLACYLILNVPLNNPFIAGILTVVGYSINDTIVIFDRIRTNIHLFKKERIENNINKSINETIGRSVATSITTLIVMIPLYLIVSTSIREFILPLMVGVIVGGYSSIFICSPVYYELKLRVKKSKSAVVSNEK